MKTHKFSAKVIIKKESIKNTNGKVMATTVIKAANISAELSLPLKEIYKIGTIKQVNIAKIAIVEITI
ncbi:hypothetical protein [Campylobacter geochelonis]|nr:hypothetical protein [Campylobacter geochelonis]